jgi:hypothetical protein
MGSSVFDAYVREEDRTAHLTALLTRVARVISRDSLERHGISLPRDLFGLAQEGRYANSVNTLTVTANRIPIPALRSRLLADAAPEYHVVAKLCSPASRVLACEQAPACQARVVPFRCWSSFKRPKARRRTNYLFQSIAPTGPNTWASRSLPQARGSDPDYAGVVQSRNRRHVKVINRDAFDMLAGNVNYVLRTIAWRI